MIRKYRLAGIMVAVASAAFIWAYSTNVAFTEEAERDNKPKESRKGRSWPSPDEIFKKMDKDGNGSVSKDEFLAAHKKRMKKMREMFKKGHHARSGKGHGHAKYRKSGCRSKGCRLSRGHGAVQRGRSYHGGGGRTVVIHNHYYGSGSRGMHAGGHQWGRQRGHHGPRPHRGHHRGHGRGHGGKDGDRKHTGHDDQHADTEEHEHSADDDYALEAELAEIEAFVYDLEQGNDLEQDNDFQVEEDSAFPADLTDEPAEFEESEDDFSVGL